MKKENIVLLKFGQPNLSIRKCLVGKFGCPKMDKLIKKIGGVAKEMKIQTFSILVGGRACNAQCPYCVSKMTPKLGVRLREVEVNWRNFEIGCKFAKQCDVSTVLMTSKGETTLFPDQITEYLKHLKPYGFSFIELQTNGIVLFQKYEEYKLYLKQWYEFGMSTIVISLVHYRNEKNKEIFQPRNRYMDLLDLIQKLHSIGFSIRLSIVMIKGFIDGVNEIRNLIKFGKDNQVEQLTIRPVERPKKSEELEVYEWVFEHQLGEQQLNEIRDFLRREATELMRLLHGAVVYDLYGQNICLTNALTIDSKSEEVRQLIFFPDGHLRYDWQYPGAILL